MPRVRSAVVLGAAAVLAGIGVVVALMLIVADAAVWAPPARTATIGELRTCTDDDLTLRVEDLAGTADADPATAGRRLALVWRNTGPDACGLEGFGVVDLVGPAAPGVRPTRFGGIVNVRREEAAAPPPAVELAPGQTARSVLRWAFPVAGARAWTPDRIVVATPGERRNQSVAWTYGPVPVGNAERPEVVFGPITGR